MECQRQRRLPILPSGIPIACCPMEVFFMYAIPATLLAVLLSAGFVGCSPTEREETREAVGDAADTIQERSEDAALTVAIKTKLLADTDVSGMRIDVDTLDRVVTLTGSVTTEGAKAKAEAIAKATSGVNRVDNRLMVSPS